MTSRASNAGFTLLEVLVTITIGLLVISAIPLALNPISESSKLLKARYQLVDALRAAQLDARRSGTVVVVSLIDDGSGYRIGQQANETRLPDGIKIISGSSMKKFDNNRIIRFFPSGQADDATWSMTFGTRTADVSVNRMTGSISMPEARLP